MPANAADQGADPSQFPLEELDRTLLRIIEQNPAAHSAWHGRALLALRATLPERACELARRAHELDRTNPDYLNTLGIALAECGRFDESEAAYRRSLKLKPASAQTHYNHGKLLYKQRKLEAAASAYRRAMAIDGDYPAARFNLASTLLDLGEPENALSLLRDAIKVRPGDEDAQILLAEAIFTTSGKEAAMTQFESVLGQHADLPRVREFFGRFLLGCGQFERGWQEYSWRPIAARSEQERRAVLSITLPGGLEGRSMLLRAEQGLGDVLFFLRFASSLAERGARLSLESPAKLASLLRRCPLLSEVFEQGSPPSSQDYACTFWLGDLPAILKRADTPPPLALSALEPNVREAGERLRSAGSPPYIGLTWRGGTDVVRGPEFGSNARALFKEIEPELLAGTIRGLPVTLIALQRNPAPGEVERLSRLVGRPVHDFSSFNDDLESMAALLVLLDDYVGVSNTNVHLRQCMGKTGRVLVPFPAEFRWMVDTVQSPWFPGFPVYRQHERRGWDAALAELRADLEKSASVATRRATGP